MFSVPLEHHHGNLKPSLDISIESLAFPSLLRHYFCFTFYHLRIISSVWFLSCTSGAVLSVSINRGIQGVLLKNAIFTKYLQKSKALKRKAYENDKTGYVYDTYVWSLFTRCDESDSFKLFLELIAVTLFLLPWLPLSSVRSGKKEISNFWFICYQQSEERSDKAEDSP